MGNYADFRTSARGTRFVKCFVLKGDRNMRLDKLTIKAQEALQTAQGLAAEYQHGELTPLHLLSALLQDKDGIVRPLLSKLGADAERIAGVAQSELKRLPSISGGSQLGMGRETQEVLTAAQKEADRL